jgi:acetyltransferase-like isoleucine patch superfamily enzyme
MQAANLPYIRQLCGGCEKKRSYHGVTMGERCRIIEPVNLYGCVLGNDVQIGPFVEIQKDVVIGDNVKIQSHSFICSGVTIEDNVFVGHGVIFCNDKYPQVNGDWEIDPIYISSGASIGSGAVILPGIAIGREAIVGAGSVVTNNIPAWHVYAGNPARMLRLRNDKKEIKMHGGRI